MARLSSWRFARKQKTFDEVYCKGGYHVVNSCFRVLSGLSLRSGSICFEAPVMETSSSLLTIVQHQNFISLVERDNNPRQFYGRQYSGTLLPCLYLLSKLLRSVLISRKQFFHISPKCMTYHNSSSNPITILSSFETSTLPRTLSSPPLRSLCF